MPPATLYLVKTLFLNAGFWKRKQNIDKMNDIRIKIIYFKLYKYKTIDKQTYLVYNLVYLNYNATKRIKHGKLE
jgi:hypothetical protein